jgi:hypothetical protein
MTDESFSSWIQTKWRPATAVVYLVICIIDFVIFPVLWFLFLYTIDSSDKTVAWDPLTLKGAGLFHLSFGAILGVSAYTRGQEKINRIKYYEPEPEYDEQEPPRRRFEPPKK